MGRPLPAVRGRRGGRAFRDADGLDYLDLSRRHRRHDGARSRRRRGRRRRAGAPRNDVHAADRGRRGLGEELARRFGLPYWQATLTATDANRFAIRLARHLTGRPKILVFHWCYHGTVDETFVTLRDGVVRARPGNLGPPVHPAVTTRVVEFNDVPALEGRARHRRRRVRARRAGHDQHRHRPSRARLPRGAPPGHAADQTLLVLDETHTISTGPGGCTRAWGLSPDMLTIGKPIAGGVPAAVYGVSSDLARRIEAGIRVDESDTGGIGGTLAGNALSLAAMRATLESVLTDEAYAKTIPLARRFAEGVAGVIAEHSLPWHVAQLGCRAEYWFRPTPPRNGSEAAAAIDPEARPLHAPRRVESRNPHDPVPQHGARLAGDDRNRHRSPYTGLPRIRGGAGRQRLSRTPDSWGAVRPNSCTARPAFRNRDHGNEATEPTPILRCPASSRSAP